MGPKSILEVHLASLLFFASAAAAQAPVYLSADPPYNAEVNVSVDLSYDASRVINKPPAMRKPTTVSAGIDQANVTSAIARRQAHAVTLQRHFAAQPSLLAAPPVHTSVLHSPKPDFTANPLIHKDPASSFLQPAEARLGKATPPIPTHGFSSHQPAQINHGFRSPDQKSTSHAPSGFNCCGNSY